MSVPYTPQPSNRRFYIPRTLAADFDRFLNMDIPNTNMDFEILKNWYDRLKDDYEPQYVRGEIYPDSTKSRYENTDNALNIRCSVTSGIRQGDMLIEPDGSIYVLDWAVHLQSNNAPSRALRCNMRLTIDRYIEPEPDDEGYRLEETGTTVRIVDHMPVNAYRYDGRPEYSAVSGTPGLTPNALTLMIVQYNVQTKEIVIGDQYVWGKETYEIIDIDRVGIDINNHYGTLKIQSRKVPGGMIE